MGFSRALLVATLVLATRVLATRVLADAAAHENTLPSYHYGAPIRVQCMNRSSETGEHIENSAYEI
ncbi:hypothetical protein B0H67DRAFT_687988 [Lasiosphaeris hirsuta]|uniref:Uncharacterized protein n=1 Tax=Lasiosphaeris hirsuta TaxID=260670 RepID=A0AA40DIQ5_9PEZI|nr:hypothetical protein B0H67DRAFT_687988 [Lasiosphaeris hirsuta]